MASDARATLTQRQGGDEIARLFDTIYRRIETRPEDPGVDKEESTRTVQKVQDEVAKGERANSNKVESSLKTLADMADDIFEVTVACLTGLAAGMATVIRKVAKKAKKKAGQAWLDPIASPEVKKNDERQREGQQR